MTSLLAVAVLLSASPEADGPDRLAKARQAMLGGARLALAPARHRLDRPLRQGR